MSSAALPSDVVVVPSTPLDAIELASRLRVEDAAEIKAAGSARTAEESLLFGYENSECYTVLYKGRVAMMFGVGRSGPYVWMLASDDIHLFSKTFIKHCRKYLRALVRNHGSLFGAVWVTNDVHVKWLGWLGATWGSDFQTTTGETFRHFKFPKEKFNV